MVEVRPAVENEGYAIGALLLKRTLLRGETVGKAFLIGDAFARELILETIEMLAVWLANQPRRQASRIARRVTLASAEKVSLSRSSAMVVVTVL